MVIMSFLLEDTETSKKYLKELSYNLRKDDFLKNPFKGFCYHFKSYPDKIKVLISMTPVYPKTTYIFIASIIPILIFNWFVWSNWYILPISLLSLNFFHSSFFFSLIFKYSLRKKGYALDIKKVPVEDTLIDIYQLYLK